VSDAGTLRLIDTRSLLERLASVKLNGKSDFGTSPAAFAQVNASVLALGS
jgi:hypothetical protein